MRLCWSEYELDEERFELRRDGAKVPVQPKVMELLLALVRNRTRVVLRKELFDAVWPGTLVTDASLSRAILEARRAIGDELQEVLVTVRGRGFRFVVEVTEKTAESPTAAPEQGAGGGMDPAFVGRVASVTCLVARLDEAFLGRGGLVWLSGEAGIGKTQMADELGRRARVRGATVYSASAHEAPAAPQFWLWAQIARAHASAHPSPRVTELMQAVAPLLDGTKDLPSATQFTLFDTYTRFFVEVARTQPLVLLLDDVHWADEGSSSLLQFFAREIRRAAIVVVGTYRDTEPTLDAHARAFAGLLGDSAGLTIPLRGLSPEDIARLVEVTQGVVPRESFTRTLYERTGGNPLYLKQVLQTEWAQRALTETASELATSMDLQQGLVESIRRHIQSVSAEAHELLTLAAVLGREFNFAELSLVSGHAHEALLDRLDEAARARVLLKSKSGGYSFTHTLVHDVLYKSLSSADRATRHAQIAEQLFAHYERSLDAHAADLAFHFTRALPRGQPERAVELSCRAAELRTAQGAHAAAAKHWKDAAQALAHLTADDPRHVDARLGLAGAAALAGEVEVARAAFVDAAVFARTFGRGASMVTAAVGYAALPGGNEGTERGLVAEARAMIASLPAKEAVSLRAKLDAAAAARPAPRT